jgi:hypothetical protein
MRLLNLERLEDRTLPSSYTAGSVTDLIQDINLANASVGSNTIALAASTTFTLTAVNNSTDGPTGLPVIAAGHNLTITGNGDTIARSTASGTPYFRLFDVAGGASLTLSSLTLQGGLASSDSSSAGGAIYNQGTLLLSGVTVQNNSAQGWFDAYTYTYQTAEGGGIWSSGALTLQNCTIQNNQAVGVSLTPPFDANGGNGFGGGLYVAAGTATLSNVTLSTNTAQGGTGGDGGWDHASGSFYPGGNGGNGFGGGLYVAGGSVSLHSTTVTSDTAAGGAGGHSPRGGNGTPGLGEGGGLYIDPAASVVLDAFTLASFRHNIASTSYPNIAGSYTTAP